MKLSHFFLPHSSTHKKAHLLSWEALLIYLLLFIFLQAGFNLFSKLNPGVLGVSSNINKERIIELTNAKRAENGLEPLSLNGSLDLAALAKANNMFEENYWAHFSPSGKDPWGFIFASGYRFSYAGENLARNFYTNEEVVNAWMNSPSHKENIVNGKYKEIGVAVVNGVLDGQETTLVVQMFGTPPQTIALNPNPKPSVLVQVAPPPIINVGGQEIALAEKQIEKSADHARFAFTLSGVAGEEVFPLFRVDQYFVMKTVGLSILGMMAILLLLDFYIINKRGIFKLTSRHWPHLGLISLAGVSLFNMRPGLIL